MNTYYIDYITHEDDLCHIWIEANSPEDAENEARHEYWDIARIVEIRKR